MSRPRFVVRTVTGYRTASYSGDPAPPGVSAHVCDSRYLFDVAATYRSEDYAAVEGHRQRRLGVTGAKTAAQRHAARLNRDTA